MRFDLVNFWRNLRDLDWKERDLNFHLDWLDWEDIDHCKEGSWVCYFSFFSWVIFYRWGYFDRDHKYDLKGNFCLKVYLLLHRGYHKFNSNCKFDFLLSFSVDYINLWIGWLFCLIIQVIFFVFFDVLIVLIEFKIRLPLFGIFVFYFHHFKSLIRFNLGKNDRKVWGEDINCKFGKLNLSQPQLMGVCTYLICFKFLCNYWVL